MAQDKGSGNNMEDFNLIAKDFDTSRRVERAKLIADEIRSHISAGHEKSTLEYGCGTGLVGFELINDFKSITFADSSPAMIEQVKEKLRCLGKPANKALCCDFMVATPQNMKLDYIFSSLVFHHIGDTKVIMTHMYNILSNGGHLLVVDIDTDDGSFHAKYPDFDGHNGFDQSALTKLAMEVGFKKAETKTFYHGCKIINGEERPYSLFILDAVK